MAGSINRVLLIGRVGKDPEIRSFNDGKEVASFSLATSESWKDKATGERKEKTEWHNVSVLNGNLVNMVKNYVKKGSHLYLEGAIQTRKYLDKQGQDRYSTEVVLQGFSCQLVLLDKAERKEAASSLLDDEAP